MGQNLTHGIYLPDEGERNCYSGLAANWQLLDSSVGTIAEHTTQIAGKANAVHTHTKSDITDLFNSANTWSGDNTYTATIKYQTSYTLGNPPQSDDAQTAIRFLATAGTNYLAQIATYQSTDATGLRFTARDKFDSNGFSPSGSNRNKHLYFVQNISNQSYLKWDGYIGNSIYPLANNTYGLGSSTFKWKTLNGLNPGALSLPDTLGTSGTENVNYFNVIGYLNNTGALATIPSTATYDGWLYINAKDGADSYIIIDDSPSSFGSSVYGNNGLGSSSVGLLCLICPIRAGHAYNVRVKSAGIVSARIYPAQGNV